LASEKYLFTLGTIGLLILASMHMLVESALDYELIILGLSFFSPFVLSLGACIKKGVYLGHNSPWSIFLILSSMFLTAPLLPLLYQNQEFLSLKFLAILSPFMLVGWYYLFSTKPNSILLKFKIRPALLFILLFALCILLLFSFGVKFI